MGVRKEERRKEGEVGGREGQYDQYEG